MDKHDILHEIRRTAEANGGVPLGKQRFYRETGIKDSDWYGKIWVRWGDALREAGFAPNQMQGAYNDDVLIEALIQVMRERGHFPSFGELRIKAHNNAEFPAHNTFTARLGPKQRWADKILDYCQGLAEYADVVAICAPLAEHRPEASETTGSPTVFPAATTKEGFVYMGLLKLGKEKRYKIGKAVLVERRTDQISLQLPDNLELVHTIKTDDAYGIEEYWHKRFGAKNTKGEWFLLSRQDVEAFKRRKFM